MLAPAFDVNPNPDPNQARATSISGATSASEEREALLQAAPYFEMTADRGVEVLTKIDTAVASWRTIAAANGIPEREQRLFADVLPPRAGNGRTAYL